MAKETLTFQKIESGSALGLEFRPGIYRAISVDSSVLDLMERNEFESLEVIPGAKGRHLSHGNWQYISFTRCDEEPGYEGYDDVGERIYLCAKEVKKVLGLTGEQFTLGFRGGR